MSRSSSSEVWSPIAKKYEPIKIGSIDGTDTYPHDHAIVRATRAHFKPDSHLKNDPEATLFVGRLHIDVKQEDLEKLFSRYGKLRKVTLVRDIATGFSKRYGFVEYRDPRDCRRARRETHRSIFMGTEILVDYEHQKTLPGWIPRRLGGGFGGRKESGQLRFGCIDRPWKKPIALQYSEHSKRRESVEKTRTKDFHEEYRHKRRKE